MYPSASQTLSLALLSLMSTSQSTNSSTDPSQQATSKAVCEKSGWFGAECQYRCRCAEGGRKCNGKTGECQGGCLQGWFGPACQYVVSPIRDNLMLPLWLRDNDDKTCNNDTLEKVEIVLPIPQPFTFLRGIVRTSTTSVKKPSVVLMKADNVTTLPCQQHFYFDSDLHSFDLYCTTRDLVSTVTLSGNIMISLCSLFISAGRVVALLQTSKIPKQLVTSHKVTSPDACHVCKTPTWMRRDNSLLLSFPVPVNVIRVDIHRHCLQHKDFDLNFFYNNSVIETSREASVLTAEEYITVLDPMILSPIDKIEITNIRVHNYLPTCQIRILGDSACQAPQYGRDCENTCNCARKGEACHVATGFCVYGCKKSFTGLDCQHNENTVQLKTSHDHTKRLQTDVLSSAVGITLFGVLACVVLILVFLARNSSGDSQPKLTIECTQIEQDRLQDALNLPSLLFFNRDSSPPSRSIQQFVAANMSMDPTATSSSTQSSDLSRLDFVISQDSFVDPHEQPSRWTGLFQKLEVVAEENQSR